MIPSPLSVIDRCEAQKDKDIPQAVCKPHRTDSQRRNSQLSVRELPDKAAACFRSHFSAICRPNSWDSEKLTRSFSLEDKTHSFLKVLDPTRGLSSCKCSRRGTTSFVTFVMTRGAEAKVVTDMPQLAFHYDWR